MVSFKLTMAADNTMITGVKVYNLLRTPRMEAIYLPFMLLLVVLFGLCVGSFLNVVIFRMPRDLSVVRPRSFCPSCRQTISWYDNIPLLSYLILRGQCRHCRAVISFRYFLIELLTASMALVTFAFTDDLVRFLVYFIFFVAPMIAVIFIDLEHRIILNEISLTGIPIGLAIRFWDAPSGLEWAALVEGVIGIVAGGGLFWLVAFVFEKIKKREGLGGGDIKLMAAFGALFGWEGVLFIMLIGSVVGSLIGVGVVWIKKDRHYQIPFGPFLVLGATLYFFFGAQMIDWYFGYFH